MNSSNNNNNNNHNSYVPLDSPSQPRQTSDGPFSPTSEGGGVFARGVGFENQQNSPSDTTTGGGGKRKLWRKKQTSDDNLPAHKRLYIPVGAGTGGGTGGDGNVEKGDHEHIENLEITKSRRFWTAIVWMLTFWLPSPVLHLCGRMKRPDVRMAWREKLAICIIIVILWFILLFIIIGLGLILCPREYVWTMQDVANINTPKKSYMAVRGNVYDITNFIKQTDHGTSRMPARPDIMAQFAGQDANISFPIPARVACPQLVSAKDDPNYQFVYPVPGTDAWAQSPMRSVPGIHTKNMDPTSKELSDPDFYHKYFLPVMEKFKKGGVVWKYDWVNSMYKDQARYWRVINKEVFDLEPYMQASKSAQNTNHKYDILDSRFINILDQHGYGTADITQSWDGIQWDAKTREINYECIKGLFYVGRIDDRQSVKCLFTNYMLVAFACLLMLVVVVKFLTALQFGKKPRPSPPSKFVLCQVPCYTEDSESIEKTLSSLAALDYGDKQKLIFVVCDGNIVGAGNELPTPRIVLDILGVDPEYDPPGRDYLAVAEGSRRHNIAKVYSGLYEFEGHVVPFMVVAKVGAPEEASRSGNRGKRDSQILLMSFFHKVHFNLPMTPLELEIYHQMRHIIGVPPRNFEYLMQVDADTEVFPDSLSRLVAACTGDQRIAGICGETMLGNESKSWTTMMQVYEYFISHHMAKAFESLFGSVTCLPGCFCMYRIRSTSGKPLLVAKPVLEAYSELHVDTLHKKNLLSLGEDRYLTTLMMKHFPSFKLKFIQDAKCRTIAPEKWSVLMSQRRRWINSTVHNLSELMFLGNMCGFCCFSMRFVVFLDLFGTLTMPTTLMYFAYLIYIAVTKVADVGYISLIIIGAIYGLQAVIFILRREWQHIGWMLIYLLAYPLWSFVLPIYSFWHMDDFSWGNTRVVVGDGKRKIIVSDDKEFDPESIPQRKWMEYEKELAAAGVLNAPPPNMNPNAGSSKDDDRLSLYSSVSAIPPQQPQLHPQPQPQPQHYFDQTSRSASAIGYTYPYPTGTGGGSSGQVTPNQHLSMYGGGGVDPRLSVNMTNQQMAALQQQQHMSAYESNRSSIAMQPLNHQSVYSNVWVPPATNTMSVYSTHQGGMLPSDQQLIDSIRDILVTADLSTVTKKVIRQMLADRYQCDLTSKREFISRIVDEMLVGK